MLTQNDLYDMTLALIIIRSDIGNETNIQVISKIIQVLIDHNNCEANQIRKAIATIKDLERERWQYVYHNNIYANHRILKNDHIYEILLHLCCELCGALKRGEKNRAFDLVDAYHCLPEIIADNHFSIPKSFWKTYIMSYRKKWDKTFLIEEQKRK